MAGAPVCGAAVVRAASKEGRKEAVVGQGREAAATEATGAVQRSEN